MAATEFQCTVRSFRMLTPTVFEVTFDADKPFTFEAGQFVSIVIPGAGPKGRDLRRAYSIASAPETSPVELCVKLVEEGPGTNFLYKLRTGDQFRGFAPYGDFTFEAKPERRACFISTGTGIAPFRAMVYSNHFKNARPLDVTCLLGVRTEDELLYLDMADVPGLKFVSTVSQPRESWTGFRGRVTDWFRSQNETYPWLETDYYLCGNGAMITEMKEILTARGVQKDSIYQEIYYK